MHVRGRAPWRQQAALCLPVLLYVCCEASGLQVFLTELALYSSSHRLRIEGGLVLYIRCNDVDVNLPEVKEAGRRYAWAAEDKPLTTLTRGGCKSCGLFEDRRIPFVDDNIFGAPWQLCEADFEASPSHDLRVAASGQFAAILHCPECAPLPPPPPPAAAPAPALAPAPSGPAPAPAPISAVQAADEAAHLSAGSGSKASGGGGSGGGGVPMAAIIGVAAAAAAGAGVALGVAVAVACRRRRARRAEERTRAFEAVFSDPELELEEVAAEDAKLFSWARLGPRWARLRDTSVSAAF